MTIGELKEQIRNINDDVEIYPMINVVDGEDSLYDQSATIEVISPDTANENGWVEVLSCPKSKTC